MAPEAEGKSDEREAIKECENEETVQLWLAGAPTLAVLLCSKRASDANLVRTTRLRLGA